MVSTWALGVSGKRVCISEHPQNKSRWILRTWSVGEMVEPGVGLPNMTSHEVLRLTHFLP